LHHSIDGDLRHGRQFHALVLSLVTVFLVMNAPRRGPHRPSVASCKFTLPPRKHHRALFFVSRSSRHAGLMPSVLEKGSEVGSDPLDQAKCEPSTSFLPWRPRHGRRLGSASGCRVTGVDELEFR